MACRAVPGSVGITPSIHHMPTVKMDFVTRQLSAKPGTDPANTAAEAPPQPWLVVTKIAFRFCFLYFGLFCLLFAQITFAFLGIVGHWLPESAVMWQMTLLEPMLSWIGSHVFGVDAVLHRDSG